MASAFICGAVMSEKTKPISIRLTEAEVEQLQARAHTLSANITAVARDLIRTGLVDGDGQALAERLMLLERRMVALEHQGRDTNEKVQSADKASRDLLRMFDELLKVLSTENEGKAA